MSNTPNINPDSSLVAAKPNTSLLKWMLPLMGILILLAVVVWMTRPREPVVEALPPKPVKTVAEVQKQMDAVKTNSHIPASEKGRILGFMGMEMEQAKARERGEAPPALSPNPPPAPGPK